MNLMKTNKKKGSSHWRDWLPNIKERQKLRKTASHTQREVKIEIPAKEDKIIVLPLSDTHIGAMATDYDKFVALTETVLNNPNIYVALIGDLTDHFVNFRNMAAVHGQILNPEEQIIFLQSWIEDIKPKVLFATWCNHSEFEEKQTGFNTVKRILEDRLVYFNGIGQADVTVGKATYNIVATHKTRYYSSFNLTHGLKQLARKDKPGGDIYIGGDKHEPDMSVSPIGSVMTTFLQLGTLKTNDVYSQRYFSFYTHAEFPCVVLDTTKKNHIPFMHVDDAIDFCNRGFVENKRKKVKAKRKPKKSRKSR